MIDLKDIVIKYGDFTAVHDLNIQIEEGEFFTFLGPSGCGKTTTLRAIAGFETPSAGTISAFGKDLSGLLPEERQLGFVFQNYALFPSMNVYENIAFGLRAHKVFKDKIDARVKAVAEKTGITEHLHKRISELSGGQQQRVAIARALVMEPKILLMDEPLSNLDAKLRVSTREEIRKLQRSFGITTIYVTHDQEEAMAISDRIAVFNHGYVEQIGPPKEIYNAPRTGVVARFIGDINCFEGLLDEQLHQLIPSDPESKYYARPHNLLIGKTVMSERDDVVSFPVTIDNFEFLGSYTKITARTVDDKRITSVMFGVKTEFDIGSEVVAVCELDNILALKEKED